MFFLCYCYYCFYYYSYYYHQYYHYYYHHCYFFVPMFSSVTKADGRSATSYRTHAAHLKKHRVVVGGLILTPWNMGRHTKKGIVEIATLIV